MGSVQAPRCGARASVCTAVWATAQTLLSLPVHARLIAALAEFEMFLDMWWLYLAGGVVLVFVIFQAWDRRHSAVRFTGQEKIRVDRQHALDEETDEYERRSRFPSKS
jgi:hypothetical protein